MNECIEKCNLDVTDNELKIYVRQLKREVEELIKSTNATLLLHDHKIAELCMYVKDNLSNTLRCMFDTMMSSGELENIITDTLLSSVGDLENKLSNISNLMDYKYVFGKDYTKAFELLCKSGKDVLVIPSGEYLVDYVEIPTNKIIIGNNVTFKRNTHSPKTLVKIGDNSIIYGDIKINGNKNSGYLNEVGITLGENVKVYGSITAYNNSRHGIIVGSNSYITNLKSYNNGVNSSGSGTGDGVYLVNVNNTIIKNVETYNNSRMGLTVTSYNEKTTGIDRTLSKNVTIDNANSYNNGYIDIDIEGVQDAHISNVIGEGKVSGSDSSNCYYENMNIKSFYADNSNYTTVKKVGCNPKGNASQVFYLNGFELYVEDITINDTADDYTSNTVQIIDGKAKGIFNNILIKNGNNGCVLTGAYEVNNVVVEKCNNRKYTIDERMFNNEFKINHGLLISNSQYKPAMGNGFNSGKYKKGDTVYNIAPTELGVANAKYIIDKWVCIKDGEANASNWLECRSLTGN